MTAQRPHEQTQAATVVFLKPGFPRECGSEPSVPEREKQNGFSNCLLINNYKRRVLVENDYKLS